MRMPDPAEKSTMKLMRIVGRYLTGMICCAALAGVAAVPSTPENLQPAWLFGEIMLTWNEVPDASGYNVYRYDTPNTVWVQTATNLPRPLYRESGVYERTIYAVSAVNQDGESAPAGPVVAEQTGDAFTIALDSWLWSIYDTVAAIQWSIDLEAGADGMLEVGTSPTNLVFFASDTNLATVHRLTLTNLSPGTFYYCRIQDAD